MREKHENSKHFQMKMQKKQQFYDFGNVGSSWYACLSAIVVVASLILT